MIKREIIDFISKNQKIHQRELIEKDLILTSLLYELSKNKKFSDEYAFKGGTCLIKAHLDYFRFSEDLDFTFIKQIEFENKSAKQIRKIISLRINDLINILEEISNKLGLEFNPNKKDEKYFEFGGGNKFSTFKIWYKSEELEKESFIKLQINFIELILFPIREFEVHNLISKTLEKEFSLNFPEESKFIFSNIKIKCYTLKEILSEKVRAILTRQGIKARDFIDIFMIEQSNQLRIESLEKEISKKIKNSLVNNKYRENIKIKKESFPEYKEGGEERLLLIEIDRNLYNNFLERLNHFLAEILKKF